MTKLELIQRVLSLPGDEEAKVELVGKISRFPKEDLSMDDLAAINLTSIEKLREMKYNERSERVSAQMGMEPTEEQVEKAKDVIARNEKAIQGRSRKEELKEERARLFKELSEPEHKSEDEIDPYSAEAARALLEREKNKGNVLSPLQMDEYKRKVEGIAKENDFQSENNLFKAEPMIKSNNFISPVVERIYNGEQDDYIDRHCKDTLYKEVLKGQITYKNYLNQRPELQDRMREKMLVSRLVWYKGYQRHVLNKYRRISFVQALNSHQMTSDPFFKRTSEILGGPSNGSAGDLVNLVKLLIKSGATKDQILFSMLIDGVERPITILSKPIADCISDFRGSDLFTLVNNTKLNVENSPEGEDTDYCSVLDFIVNFKVTDEGKVLEDLVNPNLAKDKRKNDLSRCMYKLYKSHARNYKSPEPDTSEDVRLERFRIRFIKYFNRKFKGVYAPFDENTTFDNLQETISYLLRDLE